MVGHLVNHFPVGVGEIEIILEEVTMGIYVSHHELLIHEIVTLKKIGITGVIIDDHFINLGQPIGVALRQSVVFHAEAPVGITARIASVSGHLIQLSIVQNLKDDLKEVQAISASVVLDLVLDLLKVSRELR
jgi:hypothetical protein